MPDIEQPDEIPVAPARPAQPPALASLAMALEKWAKSGDDQSWRLWVERELDEEGVPRRLAPEWWGACVDRLGEAARALGEAWPVEPGGRVAGLARAWLRYARPDGSAVFGPGAVVGAGRRTARAAMAVDADPGLAKVLDWWFPAISGRDVAMAPPPLPTDIRRDRPLAMLRPDWSRQGDLAAVDHRAAGDASLVELRGLGRRWLGPRWDSIGPPDAPPTGRPRFVHGASSSSADVYEWSFRLGAATVTRSLVLVRGRRLALLAEQVDGAGGPEGWRVDLDPGVTVRPIPETRGLFLVGPGGRPMAQALPLGLPCAPGSDERGTFGLEDGRLALRQADAGRRRWRPLLVSWEGLRNRKAVVWRTVTVAEKSKACEPGVAFAARAAWGLDEGIVLYRSLAKPGLRSFLGHQTRARFLLGGFNRSGDVEPWLTVEG